ncbi:MAG TPA: hypothetical protein VGX68_17115 [Thermoanaerobaculia bacterium]|nr:hypothetical protein [Thermoanaerobaculia bacterium]
MRIARALEIEPAEIFQIVYPKTPDPPTEGAQRLRQALSALHPPPAATPPPPLSASQNRRSAVRAARSRPLASETGSKAATSSRTSAVRPAPSQISAR